MAANCSEVSLLLCFSFGQVVLFTYRTPFESYPAFFISRPGALIAKGK